MGGSVPLQRLMKVTTFTIDVASIAQLVEGDFSKIKVQISTLCGSIIAVNPFFEGKGGKGGDLGQWWGIYTQKSTPHLDRTTVAAQEEQTYYNEVLQLMKNHPMLHSKTNENQRRKGAKHL
jgi:hypothetical protein